MMADEPDGDEFEDDADQLASEQPTVDAGNRQTLRGQKAGIAKEKAEGVVFWRAVLTDSIGRCEVWRLLQDAHTFETRFACGPNGFPQPEGTWFQAGQQDFGLRLYQKLLALDPVLVMTMHRENDPRFMPPAPKRQRRSQAGE